MNNSNPIEDFVHNIGLEGRNARIASLLIFAASFYVAIGIFLEGLYA